MLLNSITDWMKVFAFLPTKEAILYFENDRERATISKGSHHFEVLCKKKPFFRFIFLVYSTEHALETTFLLKEG